MVLTLEASVSKAKPEPINAARLRNRKIRTIHHKQPARVSQVRAATEDTANRMIFLLCFRAFSINVLPLAPVSGASYPLFWFGATRFKLISAQYTFKVFSMPVYLSILGSPTNISKNESRADAPSLRNLFFPYPPLFRLFFFLWEKIISHITLNPTF